jgi:hypothetical protein
MSRIEDPPSGTFEAVPPASVVLPGRLAGVKPVAVDLDRDFVGRIGESDASYESLVVLYDVLPQRRRKALGREQVDEASLESTLWGRR